MIEINIKLFASLREALKDADFTLALPTQSSVSQIIDALAESKGQQWQDLLSESKVLIAVNQTMVDRQHVLDNGDELAFFPPVTGG